MNYFHPLYCHMAYFSVSWTWGQWQSNKLYHRIGRLYVGIAQTRYYVTIQKDHNLIVESVDSICRDSTDMQCMLTQKILKIFKTANL